jgi:TPR repeat protein
MTRRAFDLADHLADQRRYRDAFRVLLNAARKGDASVFLNLAYAYDTGRGIRQSKRRALHWYLRALKSGEAVAAHNIATVHRDRGSALRAARWFRRAVALGQRGSNLELGQLLLGGLGQPAEAVACFRAVGSEESLAVNEAAKTWAAVAEGVVAQ